MGNVHPWLASHPDAIPWPETHDDMTPEFIERVMSSCSREALIDIVRTGLEAQRAEVERAS